MIEGALHNLYAEKEPIRSEAIKDTVDWVLARMWVAIKDNKDNKDIKDIKDNKDIIDNKSIKDTVDWAVARIWTKSLRTSLAREKWGCEWRKRKCGNEWKKGSEEMGFYKILKTKVTIIAKTENAY